MAGNDKGDVVYESFNIYSVPDKFWIEPRVKDEAQASRTHLQIDRLSGELEIAASHGGQFPLPGADVQSVIAIIGTIDLVAGRHLIVVKRAELVGVLLGADIFHIRECDLLPYRASTSHLNERQLWFNRNFTEMMQLVLSTDGFYFAIPRHPGAFDISHSLQWLSENASPQFRQASLIERACPRFTWNRHLSGEFMIRPDIGRYITPIIHGFIGIEECTLRGSVFKLALISRRCIHRAGTRFHSRGTDLYGNSANFIETEQIVEFGQWAQASVGSAAAFLQTRGSIPLYWTQRPNLKWQPYPLLKPTDDQLHAFKTTMNLHHQWYNGRHVLINLVNKHGREKVIGSELERVYLQARLEFVKYIAFDFHKECQPLQWDRLDALRDLVHNDIKSFGIFYSPVGDQGSRQLQTGYFRTNCMDCLDRTNVVQALLAKEALHCQLVRLGVLEQTAPELDYFPDFLQIYKNLWADNADQLSKQYAGSGALKTDYTRLGRRTVVGALNDAYNSLTRYIRNNFTDGYKQDAMDLFLGNYKIDPANLPPRFEYSLLSLDANGGAIAGSIFSGAMMLLCVLISENMTATFFWLALFASFLLFIFLHGEEFCSMPKLKLE